MRAKFAKAWLYLLLALLLLAAFTVPLQAAMQSPTELVKQTTQRIVEAVRREQPAIKKDPARLYQIVDEIVLPHFDFHRMSSWVLGKYWRTASPQEREQFVREFRTLLVRTYAKALNDNYDKPIDIMPARMEAGAKTITVHTEVQQDSGFPIPIDYKMYLNDKGEWLVYDVIVDSVSLVTNYRTSFGQEVRSDGLPKLIARLAKRNQQAAGE